MNTVLNKLEKVINLTPTGEARNILTNINITLNKELHLCDRCIFHIATCSAIGIEFGNGKGDDNVIRCETYKFDL